MSIDNQEKLLEIIGLDLKPDKFNIKTNGEVFTPINTITQMLKKLEKFYLKTRKTSIWSNEKLTWFDPSAGTGNFPVVIYFFLMNGLASIFPEEIKRKKHILTNMIYMAEINTENVKVIKQRFGNSINIYTGDSLNLDIKKQFRIEKFDVIVGNPPYNDKFSKITSGITVVAPLYNKFIEKYIDKCNYLSFIVPSRWFTGGQGLSKFRCDMLNRRDIVYIEHFENASEIFKDIHIAGGVNYFLKSSEYNGACLLNGQKINLQNYDIIVNPQHIPLINKIIEYIKKHGSISDLYNSSSHYSIGTNDSRLVNPNTIESHVDKSSYLKCYVSEQKGFIKYIQSKYVTENSDFWKVITAEATYVDRKQFGRLIIGKPYEVHSQSYISFKVKNQKEATSLESFLKCKLPNFLLCIRKKTQHTNRDTCKWIPLVPLDRLWDDNKLITYIDNIY